MFGRRGAEPEIGARVTRLFPRDTASTAEPAAPAEPPVAAPPVAAPPVAAPPVAAPILPPSRPESPSKSEAAPAPATPDPEPKPNAAPTPAPTPEAPAKDEKYWAQVNADRDRLRALRTPAEKAALERAKSVCQPVIQEKFDKARARRISRGQLAGEIKDVAMVIVDEAKIALHELAQRDLVTFLINDTLSDTQSVPVPSKAQPTPARRWLDNDCRIIV